MLCFGGHDMTTSRMPPRCDVTSLEWVGWATETRPGVVLAALARRRRPGTSERRWADWERSPSNQAPERQDFNEGTKGILGCPRRRGNRTKVPPGLRPLQRSQFGHLRSFHMLRGSYGRSSTDGTPLPRLQATGRNHRQRVETRPKAPRIAGFSTT